MVVERAAAVVVMAPLAPGRQRPVAAARVRQRAPPA
jgi:hypothetical protein